MKSIKKTLLLLLSLTIFSCYSLDKEKLVDVYDFDHLNKKQFSQQIELRVDKIKELEDNVYKLKNYNRKFKPKLINDGLDYIKTEAIDRVIYNNDIMIFKFETEIKKLKKELEILSR